ncbi:MAG: hypothetical protein FWC50_01765 [Planctomycetaceae bacterium]|nr:hypothetical protein [Planctomycetaceae bacterium]
MSHIKKMRKTVEEREAQIEKLQQYVTEICDRECRQQDLERLEQIRREKRSQKQRLVPPVQQLVKTDN